MWGIGIPKNGLTNLELVSHIFTWPSSWNYESDNIDATENSDPYGGARDNISARWRYLLFLSTMEAT